MKRVLIIKTGSLLDDGLKSLLMRESELQVATATYTESIAFLMGSGHIDHDVIVISEVDSSSRIQTSELLHRISAQATLRVIVIRLDNNVIDVYDKQCLKLTCNNELVTLVTKDTVSAAPS